MPFWLGLLLANLMLGHVSSACTPGAVAHGLPVRSATSCCQIVVASHRPPSPPYSLLLVRQQAVPLSTHILMMDMIDIVITFAQSN